jgi:hypothetical protein
MAPTWGKHQHQNQALLLAALQERPSLVLTELARAYPQPAQPLHGRLKHLTRFLDNPRLDEVALFVRWLQLAYGLEDHPQNMDCKCQWLPILLDTVYFDPFALLVATVPCGSRGLPVGLTTYHRQELEACFPPRRTWPCVEAGLVPTRRVRGKRPAPAAAMPQPFISQNTIEERLIEYVSGMVSPAFRTVWVADRGFARAELFRDLISHRRSFVIRVDAQTHMRIPEPLALDRPCQGTPTEVLGLRPTQRLWCPRAWYGKEEQVPVRLLAIWDKDQEEPWYLVTNLKSAKLADTFYRRRMRLECANRDEKTGVILREGGDDHKLTNLMHVHRLLLSVALTEWLCALTGLQALRDLPAQEQTVAAPSVPLPEPDHDSQDLSIPQPAAVLAGATGKQRPISALPPMDSFMVGGIPLSRTPGNLHLLDEGPGLPPPVLPHRGDIPKVPAWMRRFAVWGPLSYVRLGMEVLRAPDLGNILHRLVRWLGARLWHLTPPWRPWQLRYRINCWWSNTS